MNEPREWKDLYAAAMLESDIRQMRQKIEKADAAMHARLQELPDTSAITPEKIELESAVQYLRRLKASIVKG